MSNPSRGCGSKKHDAFYIEGVLSANGQIYSWTWCLGDGRNEVAYLEPPARKDIIIDPAACLVTQELIRYSDGYNPVTEDERIFYGQMLNATFPIGIVSHVGSKFYTAVQFAKETMEYGPSRRVSEKSAMVYLGLMNWLESQDMPRCFPILFTHSQVPVFDSAGQNVEAVMIAHDLITSYSREWREESHFDACWQVDNWGMYRKRNQYAGYYSAHIPMLDLIDRINRDWHIVGQDPNWKRAKEFVNSLEMAEQTIGLSLINQVSYTLPRDGKVNPKLLAQRGLNIINLEAEEDDQRVSERSGNQLPAG